MVTQTPAAVDTRRYEAVLSHVTTVRARGRVVQVVGVTAEAEGVSARLGEICHIFDTEGSARRAAEVVGFRQGRLLLMPLESLAGVRPGASVVGTGGHLRVPVGPGLLGRTLDGLARPIDEQGAIDAEAYVSTEPSTPSPLTRARIDEPFYTGIRAIDTLLTLGVGQRIGIFAGSGVGKSTVLGMIARYAASDVNVIALIGERGREVREFIEDSLGEEGQQRSVLVVATSDQPALVRLNAARVATAIAEWFRDRGRRVLLMMDSLTRFAMAQREIGLATGEPPALRGYTPSVFAMLPALLERAGTAAVGSITGLYTVLVEGDDLQEPVADTVRGVLDGHIVLSRALAQEHHYPAIDVLASISRLAPMVQGPEQQRAVARLRELLAAYADMRDLISIGAYQAGSNPDVDYMLQARGDVNTFLRQAPDERSEFAPALTRLLTIAPPAPAQPGPAGATGAPDELEADDA